MSIERIISLCENDQSVSKKNKSSQPKEVHKTIVPPPTKQTKFAGDIIASFEQYLKTKVSRSSVTSYIPAFKTLEKMLVTAGIIERSFAECLSPQIMNSVQEYLSKDSVFIAFNKLHHHTYSAVWRKFKDYISSEDSVQMTFWEDQDHSKGAKENETTSKTDQASVSVLFPDGTTVQCKTVAKTFAETINRIGPERVARLNFKANGEPLVSHTGSKKYPRSNIALNDGFFLITQSNTRTKIAYLSKISELLGLGLKISVY